MTTVHADNLPRVMQCLGSRVMPADLPPNYDGSQVTRDEGNATHWLAQQIFDKHTTLEHVASVPTRAPNGIFITSDMIEHVGGYLATVSGGAMEVNTSYGGTGWFVAGRADWIYFDGVTLHVKDFKYGWRVIEPDENWTLISHAIGYCLAHGITSCNVELTIHQPRAHHPDGKVRSWRTNYAHLQRYYGQIAARLSEEPNALETGPFCGTCHAAASCPANRKSTYNAMDAIEDSIFSDDLTDALLAYEMENLTLAQTKVKNRLQALEELTKHRVQNGAVVGNFALERQLGNRRWNEALSPDILRALTGKDLSKPGVVTPSEAERRGVPKQVIATLTNRPETGLRLVRRDIDKAARRALGSK